MAHSTDRGGDSGQANAPPVWEPPCGAAGLRSRRLGWALGATSTAGAKHIKNPAGGGSKRIPQRVRAYFGEEVGNEGASHELCIFLILSPCSLCDARNRVLAIKLSWVRSSAKRLTTALSAAKAVSFRFISSSSFIFLRKNARNVECGDSPFMKYYEVLISILSLVHLSRSSRAASVFIAGRRAY